MSWDSSNTVTVTVDGREVEVDEGANFASKVDELINEYNISSAVVSVTYNDGSQDEDISSGDAPATFETVESASIDKAKDMA